MGLHYLPYQLCPNICGGNETRCYKITLIRQYNSTSMIYKKLNIPKVHSDTVTACLNAP